MVQHGKIKLNMLLSVISILNFGMDQKEQWEKYQELLNGILCFQQFIGKINL
jgi:hypothetical protein